MELNFFGRLKWNDSLLTEEYSLDSLTPEETDQLIDALLKRFKCLINTNQALGIMIDEQGYSEEMIDWNNFFLKKPSEMNYSPVIIGAKYFFLRQLVNRASDKVKKELIEDYAIFEWR